VIGNSFGKEATVEQLPISRGIAGVSMRIEPGKFPHKDVFIADKEGK
jgi:hypothetical protein